MRNRIHRNRISASKGFTLMETLIVIAIIAVLVAVAIPIFSDQLEKAKTATDDANAKIGIELASTQYMTDEESGEATYYFDLSTITVYKAGEKSASSIKGYGKSTVAGTVAVTAAGVATPGIQGGLPCIVKVVVTPNDSGTTDARAEYIIPSGLNGTTTITVNGKTYSPAEYLASLVSKVGLNNGKSIDSTSPSGAKTTAVKAAIATALGWSTSSVQTWSIKKDGSGNISAYVSDVDISSLPVNSWVRVVKYDVKTKTYTAGYMLVDAVTSSNTTYNWLDGKNTSNFVASGTATTDYASATAVYNSLQEIKS